MTLREILSGKGDALYHIGPDATLREVAVSLVQHRVGALLVMTPDHLRRRENLLGIVTERDFLGVCAREGDALDRCRVAEVMSPQVITGTLDDLVEDVMGLMTRERKRHLPVVDGQHIVGMISIGDLVKWQHHHLSVENRFMKDYIRS